MVSYMVSVEVGTYAIKHVKVGFPPVQADRQKGFVKSWQEMGESSSLWELRSGGSLHEYSSLIISTAVELH